MNQSAWNQKVTWPMVLIILVLGGGLVWIFSVVSRYSAADAAKELFAADKGKPNPYGKDVSDYRQRVERLQELTGSSPEEIQKVTVRLHQQLTGQNQMSCFQFMSAIITFTRSSAPPGKDYREWSDYEEAAQAFVDFVQPGGPSLQLR